MRPEQGACKQVRQHRAELEAIADERKRLDRLCELNVLQQRKNVASDVFVQDAWARGQELVVHGWFYGLNDGLLRDLKITVPGAAEMASAFDEAITALHARHAAMGVV